MASYYPLSQPPSAPPAPQIQSELCSNEPPQYLDAINSSQMQTEWHNQHYPPAANVTPQQLPPLSLPPLYHYQPCPANTVSPVVLNRQFGQTPVPLRCPNCQKDVVTVLVYESGAMVWIAVGIIFLLALFVIVPLFLFWIPFLIDDFKDITHTCPNCCYVFGKYKRI